eukprot:2948549-Lingulodinium_polyedra.AAC.1
MCQCPQSVSLFPRILPGGRSERWQNVAIRMWPRLQPFFWRGICCERSRASTGWGVFHVFGSATS